MIYDDISALLTPGQREYLLGDSDIESGSANERATRGRIRSRLTQAIGDLAILNANLESRDVEQAFEPIDFNDIAPAIALILDGFSRVSKYQHGAGERDIPDDEVTDMFTDFYASALKEMYVKRGIEVEDITVDIDIELGDSLDQIASKDLSEISEKQLIQLLESGEINKYEFIDTLMMDSASMDFDLDEDDFI